MASLPPGTIILLGSFLLPMLPDRWRKVTSIILPMLSMFHLLGWHPAGHQSTIEFFEYVLTPIRVDKLSLVWGYAFHIAAILAAVYGFQERNPTHHACAAAYIGAAIGAVFSGDLLTLFVYWEITAVASVFLVWAGKTRGSVGAGMRYALFHIGSGVLVLGGTLATLVERGSLSFGGIDEVGIFHDLSTWGAKLLLCGFGIKAAFPLVHTWLAESYSKATAAGAVVLSAFTTKMAIYALARGFAQAEVLVVIGSMMCIVPLVHALLSDDLRQTLAHVLNNQLGFMVVAVGVGTPVAISGVAAMAFAHVIYKGLLFMAMGAVLTQTGTVRQSEIGGLGRNMRWTSMFCLVGAFSVLPLNCGFVTKSIVLGAIAEAHLETVWLLLVVGAAGAFLTAGLKVPYFAFFARSEPSHNVDEAPGHMLIAMGISAALCLAIGIFPNSLYRLLPFEVDQHPYTVSHVVQQLQLLSGVTFVFAVLLYLGSYPRPVSGTLLDVDWFYRRPLKMIASGIMPVDLSGLPLATQFLVALREWARSACGPAGCIGRSVSTNVMAIFAMIVLAVYLLVYY